MLDIDVAMVCKALTDPDLLGITVERGLMMLNKKYNYSEWHKEET